MLYFINPKRKEHGMARRKHRTAAQRRATARLLAFNRARRAGRKRAARKAARTRARRHAPPKVRRRRAPATGTHKRRRSMARHRRGRRRGGRRHGRRGTGIIKFKRVRGSVYSRNPGFSIRGVIGTLKTAVPRAAAVVAGKATTRIVANFLPLPKDGIMNTVTQVISALIVGTVAKMIVPARIADDLVVGGIVAPIESLAKGLPVIGPALGDDDLVLGEYYQGAVGEYLTPGVGDVGAEDIGEYEYA